MSMSGQSRIPPVMLVGKIYNNCAATILDTVDGEGGKWYRIQLSTVNGYIKAQYFIYRRWGGEKRPGRSELPMRKWLIPQLSA